MPLRIPIRVKITMPYMLLVIVFSIGVAFLASRIILETVDERFGSQLYEAGQIASEAVAREEIQMLASLRLLVNLKDVPEAIQMEDAERLRALVVGAVINQQEEVVEFLDLDLNVVLSMHHVQGGLLEEYDYVRGGGDFAGWAFARQAASGSDDDRGDKYAGLVQNAWGNFFYIAGPVYREDGQQVGVIMVGRRLNTLARILREATLSQVTFYTPGGDPLASTFPDPMALDTEAGPLVLENQARASLRRSFSALRMNYGEILGPFKVRGDVNLGLMGVALLKNTLVNASLPTRLEITGLIALMMSIILITGINLAAVITRPLLNLVKASQQVALGDLLVQVPVTTGDEIGELARSFNQMVASLRKSKQDLLETYDETLISLSKALELRDYDTEGHSQNVTAMTMELAQVYGFPEEQMDSIRRGALLHDIGKIGVPDHVLRKNGPLSAEEWVVMRQHPVFGYNLLKNIDFLRNATDIPYCHHERWDGSGYPRGLKGLEIPVTARLFAIVDMWEALNADRAYRRKMDPAKAVQLMHAGRGTHFDPELLDLFLAHFNLPPCPPGAPAARMPVAAPDNPPAPSLANSNGGSVT